MRIKNILIILFIMFLTCISAKAEDISPILTARKPDILSTNKLIENDSNAINLDNSDVITIPDTEDSPVFQPYRPAKDEVVFSYTKNLINAIKK